MEVSTMRARVIEEIRFVPEYKLAEVYDFVHYFRLGLQNARGDAERIMQFAGCWADMPDALYAEFLADIARRRRQAFSRRRRDEASAR